MNAINFIKQHGVDKAREVADDAPDRATTTTLFTILGYIPMTINKIG